MASLRNLKGRDMDPMMQMGGMPPPMPPGMGGVMPPPAGPMSMGPPIGMDGAMPCPLCGSMMPSPNTMAGPNVPIPPEMLSGGQDQTGALLQALMGAGGSSGM